MLSEHVSNPVVEESLLAIVIPAFKVRHLERALGCIAAQTDGRFRVYVGDDASPEDIAGCVENCAIPKDKLVYHRFESNLGGASLIKQWDRCIRLCTEPWVWLFSDDDEMDPGCVAAFHAALKETDGAFDLYRFNVVVVDDRGAFLDFCPPHPEVESVLDYTYFFVMGVRRITQQEAIFRRRRYEEIGGVPDYPMAWYSDSAFAMRCGSATGIRTISGPKVRFRLGGENISSQIGMRTVERKWQALMDFCELADEVLEEIPVDSVIPTRSRAKALLRIRFLKGVQRPRRWIGKAQRSRFAEFMSAKFPGRSKEDRIQLWRFNLELIGHRIKMSGRGFIRKEARKS